MFTKPWLPPLAPHKSINSCAGSWPEQLGARGFCRFGDAYFPLKTLHSGAEPARPAEAQVLDTRGSQSQHSAAAACWCCNMHKQVYKDLSSTLIRQWLGPPTGTRGGRSYGLSGKGGDSGGGQRTSYRDLVSSFYYMCLGD